MVGRLVVVAAVLLAASASPFMLGSAPTRAALTRTAPVPRFESTACDAQIPLPKGTRCGFLVVPENRTKRTAKTIRVAVAVVPAQAKRPDPVPLVYLGGGPGGLPIFQFATYLAAGYNADRDLILVDQRGTYLSQPQLTCPVFDRFNARLVGLVSDAESTKREHVAATRACRAEFIAKGVDIGAYNTTENVADFVALRHVLGYKQWNVYGTSYGVDLALNLMRVDPAGIRSVVLDSTVPPDLVALAAFWPNARDGFDNLFAACAAQRACRSSFPNLRARFTQLVGRLEAHPARTRVMNPATHRTVDVTTDGGALANWLVGMSLQPKFQDVPRWLDEFAKGNPQAVALSRATSITPEGYVGVGLVFGVVCSEWVPFQAYSQILRDGRRVFPTFPTSVLAEAPQFTYMTDDCRVWNVPKAPAVVRAPVRSRIPTLLLSGNFDAITSLRWAKAAARTLSNSKILVLPGVGHDVADSSRCAQTAMRSFFARPQSPDVRCQRTATPATFNARGVRSST